MLHLPPGLAYVFGRGTNRCCAHSPSLAWLLFLASSLRPPCPLRLLPRHTPWVRMMPGATETQSGPLRPQFRPRPAAGAFAPVDSRLKSMNGTWAILEDAMADLLEAPWWPTEAQLSHDIRWPGIVLAINVGCCGLMGYMYFFENQSYPYTWLQILTALLVIFVSQLFVFCVSSSALCHGSQSFDVLPGDLSGTNPALFKLSLQVYPKTREPLGTFVFEVQEYYYSPKVLRWWVLRQALAWFSVFFYRFTHCNLPGVTLRTLSTTLRVHELLSTQGEVDMDLLKLHITSVLTQVTENLPADRAHHD